MLSIIFFHDYSYFLGYASNVFKEKRKLLLIMWKQRTKTKKKPYELC